MRKAGGNWFSYYLGRENIALRITGWSRRCSVLSFGVCFYIYSKFSVPRDENITRTWIVGFVSERRRRGLCVVVFAGFLHFNQKGPFSGEKPVNQRIPHALQLRNNNNQREGTIKGRHGRGGYEKGDRKHVVCVCAVPRPDSANMVFVRRRCIPTARPFSPHSFGIVLGCEAKSFRYAPN